MANIQKKIQEKLTKNLIDTIVLQLLNNQSMCGYEIIATIKKQYGVYLGASTMYPMLNEMEKKKLAKSQWNFDSNRSKKIYHLTPHGEEMLHFTASSLNRICRRIDRVNKKDENFEVGIMP
jgi:DNA-binding PadR family transcriptional regulator